MEQKRTLCLLLQLPSRVKSWSKVSLVPGQISNLPPVLIPYTVPGFDTPWYCFSLQPPAWHQPQALLPKPLTTAPARAGNGREEEELLCAALGLWQWAPQRQLLKKSYCTVVRVVQGTLISITICLLCHGCFGASKFRIVHLSCKCVLFITWPCLTNCFWKCTYLKYLYKQCLLCQTTEWLEYCHPICWRRISQSMYVFCKLMILCVLGIIFFQEIRRNVKYGGS